MPPIATLHMTLTFSPTCHLPCMQSFNSKHFYPSRFKDYTHKVLLLPRLKHRPSEWNGTMIRRSESALSLISIWGRGGRVREGVKGGSMKFKLMLGRWNWRLQYKTKERVGAGMGERMEERQANWFVWGMGRARRDEKGRVMGEGWRRD